MPLIEVVVKKDGQVVQTVTLPAKSFSTGSVGYYAQAKLDIDGDGVKHQGSFQLVKIGSKDKAKAGRV